MPSKKQIRAAKRNIKIAQRHSPAAKCKPNVYSNGKDFNVAKESAAKFMRTHNKAQRIYMHSILHSPAGKAIPHDKRKTLHDKIVRKDLAGGMKEHKTPMR